MFNSAFFFWWFTLVFVWRFCLLRFPVVANLTLLFGGLKYGIFCLVGPGTLFLALFCLGRLIFFFSGLLYSTFRLNDVRRY